MAIYRGSGSAGDANNTVTISEVAAYSLEAENSAAEALQSEQRSDVSETNAAASATAAANSASSANGSVTLASGYASSASTSKNAAADSAEDASKLAVTAEDSQYTLADGTTVGYSSLHYAAKAATSATSASTAQTAAETAQTGAETAQTAAETAKTGAETAQTAAETAQTAAEAAETNAQNLFTQFGDQYLGSFASEPTTDNSGNDLTEGDIFWDATNDVLKFYSGSAWVAPESIATTAASNASASATAAGDSATAAAASATAAAASATAFTSSEAYTITSTDTTNWDTAFGWGNHASAGYITGYTETDTLATVTGRGATTTNDVTFGKVTAKIGVGATQTASVTGTTTLDFSTYQNFVLTLTGNTTLANPTTETVGQSGFITIIQDATGSRTVSLSSEYKTAGAAGLTLSTAASAVDVVPYVVSASGSIILGSPTLAVS